MYWHLDIFFYKHLEIMDETSAMAKFKFFCTK